MGEGTGATINNSGTWNDQNTFNNVIASEGGTAVFNNTGTYSKTGAGTTTVGVAFNNSGAGSLSVQNGIFEIAAAGTSSAGFTTASGATTQFGGGTYQLNSGATLGGTGLYLVSGGGTLSANTTIGVTNLTVAGGTLTGAGPVNVGGTLTINGGVLTGVGGITNSNGTLTLGPGAVEVFNGYTLNNISTANWSSTSVSSSEILVGEGTGATINNSGTWNDQNTFNNVIASEGGTAVFNNTGTYSKTGAGTTTVGVAFNNSGAGSLSVQNGIFEIAAAGTSSAGFTTASGATTQFGGGTYQLNSGATLGGTGLYLVSGGGTLSANTTIGVTNLTVAGGTLTGAGPVNVGGTLTINSGVLTGVGGITNSNGTLTLGPGAVEVFNGYTLNNIGTANWSSTSVSSSEILVGEGTGATINNSGTWNDQNIFNNVIASEGGTAVFNNSGTYSKTGTGTTTVSTAFNNSGLLDVQSGVMSLSGATNTNTATGTMEATTGGTLNVTAGLTNFSSNTLTNGTYIVNGTGAASTMSLSVGTNAGGEIVNNAANIVLDGANSAVSFVDLNGHQLLSALAANTTSSSGLTIENGYNLTTPGAFANAGTVTVGTASGDTSTFKIGPSGASAYTQSAAGALTQGTGTIAGNVTVSNGNVAPGSTTTAGTLSITGNYAQSGGTFTDVLGASSNGLLNVSGTVTLASPAALGIVLGSGFVATDGTLYTIITGHGGLSGQFATGAGGTEFQADGFNWTIGYSGGNAILDLINAVGSGPTDVTATWTAGSGAWTTASQWSCSPGSSTCVPNNSSSDVYETVLNSSGHTLTLGSGNAFTVNTLALQAGTLDIASGASLNLVNQANGLTDIAAGAGLTLGGTLTVDGTTNGLAKLGSVEGALTLANGATTTATPGSGTLIVSGSRQREPAAGHDAGGERQCNERGHDQHRQWHLRHWSEQSDGLGRAHQQRLAHAGCRGRQRQRDHAQQRRLDRLQRGQSGRSPSPVGQQWRNPGVQWRQQPQRRLHRRHLRQHRHRQYVGERRYADRDRALHQQHRCHAWRDRDAQRQWRFHQCERCDLTTERRNGYDWLAVELGHAPGRWRGRSKRGDADQQQRRDHRREHFGPDTDTDGTSLQCRHAGGGCG